MARSFADYRPRSGIEWTKTIPFGRRIFDFYPSQGDLVVPAAGLTIPNTEDGPITISRYRRLEINGPFTKQKRDRGWCVLCDDLILGAGARPNMAGKGAAGSPKWAVQDIAIPRAITLSGHRTQYDDFAAWLRENCYAIFDPSLFACPLPGTGDVTANYKDWPASGPVIVSAAGCGSTTARVYGGCHGYGSAIGVNGPTGYAGVNAPGGGGGGGNILQPATNAQGDGNSATVGTTGSAALPWSGGIRGLQGVYTNYTGSSYPFSTSTGDRDGDPYSTIASSRPGGILIVLVRNSVTAIAGHLLSANATTDGVVAAGHGAGRVFLGYGGALTGTLNMAATGGAAGAYCGHGGAGAVTAKTLAEMGWA
ncbi:hypothetical protein DesfrDRAFT_0045 [Solidesulfovibrio fructosivorans JJ]]|uniref:Uncharacterized protein n=1 Tax=Solidesulfovibrio fructosivorans JJ] TaxID=596151 RepID=E1JQZ6_SOLFR|nr:hypothetical protein [Solidesulfovibrio fructosivorans]EFL52997.1 hypothetical protein DesfrDRAFT_0045 [Solidesulfovibrio fructosivorans JJ]]